jgi:uncharacterized OB-fold protein
MVGIATQDVSWNINYKIHLGEVWGRFMDGLKDRRVTATSCDRCGRVFVPPQPFCETCFEPASTWLDVPARGKLHTFTVSYHEFLGSPPAPYALGAIELEGADTLLIHFLGGADLSTPETVAETFHVGDTVAAVWVPEPKGHILDIVHFTRDAAAGAD